MAAHWTERNGWRAGDAADGLLSREWLVTNGLGGYAAGTVGGAATRRFHAPLVSALPAPRGRIVALARLDEALVLDGGDEQLLTGMVPFGRGVVLPEKHLREFVLEDGLPVWRYATAGIEIEKRLVLPYRRNAVHVRYRIDAARGAVTITLRPWFNLRPHEGAVTAIWDALHTDSDALVFPYECVDGPRGIEVRAKDGMTVRVAITGPRHARFLEHSELVELRYDVEAGRGYDACGPIASPGRWRLLLEAGDTATVIASTDDWPELLALSPEDAFAAEAMRRGALLERAPAALRSGRGAELLWAADQFLVTPRSRVEDECRQQAAGHEARAVIAGYHWFTDWGRDSMIALEGLALVPGKAQEAAHILRTVAAHVQDGLVPNFFPEGAAEAVYHTADASLWFVHALARHDACAGDPAVRRELMPVVLDVVRHHLRGTRFGIGMDPRDGLMRQGEQGRQLTWMDAKVGDWVVTPRRGKAVEINALWYNALRWCARWSADDGDAAAADEFTARAATAYAAFNARFWNPDVRYCHDVVDVDGVDGVVDASLRPNQLFAISLPHPVLDPARWRDVMAACRERLLTPVGVRTLAPGHPAYQPRYDGDVRSRDAAYHQGSVWPWLLGPLVDAWLRTYGPHPEQLGWLAEGIDQHLAEACLGQVSEIMDAEAPFHPRGCVAQAWSVGEVIRALMAIEGASRDLRDPGPAAGPARTRS